MGEAKEMWPAHCVNCFKHTGHKIHRPSWDREPKFLGVVKFIFMSEKNNSENCIYNRLRVRGKWIINGKTSSRKTSYETTVSQASANESLNKGNGSKNNRTE